MKSFVILAAIFLALYLLSTTATVNSKELNNDDDIFFDSYFSSNNLTNNKIITTSFTISSFNSETNQTTINFQKSYQHPSLQINQNVNSKDSIFMVGPSISNIFIKLLYLLPENNLLNDLQKSVNELLLDNSSKVKFDKSILGNYQSWSRLFPYVKENNFLTVNHLITHQSGIDFRESNKIFVKDQPIDNFSNSDSLQIYLENLLKNNLAPRIRQTEIIKNREEIDGISILGYLFSKIKKTNLNSFLKTNILEKLNMLNTFNLFTENIKNNLHFIKHFEFNDKNEIKESNNFNYFTKYPVTSTVFTNSDDLNKLGVFLLQNFNKNDLINKFLFYEDQFYEKKYLYHYSKIGNYFTMIVIFPEDQIVMTMTSLAMTQKIINNFIENYILFKFNNLKNNLINDCNNLNFNTYIENNYCNVKLNLNNLKPLYNENMFKNFKNKMEGCFINVEYEHSTYLKYFTMKEIICLKYKDNYFSGNIYNFDLYNTLNQLTSIKNNYLFNSFDNLIFLQSEFSANTFRLGYLKEERVNVNNNVMYFNKQPEQQVNTMVVFENYLSNKLWKVHTEDDGGKYLYLEGPFITLKYERFTEEFSFFWFSIGFGIVMILGLITIITQFVFLIIESRNRLNAKYNNLQNVDLKRVMIQSDDYVSSDDELDVEMDDKISNSLQRYNASIKKERQKRKNSTNNTILQWNETSRKKRWAITIFTFTVTIVNIFFFVLLKAANIMMIIGIYFESKPMLFVPLIISGLIGLNFITLLVEFIVRCRVCNKIVWIFIVLNLIWNCVDIAFLILLMRINWFGYWNAM
ncbi:hypothetical protein ABK040_011886 [Willaertia magna]